MAVRERATRKQRATERDEPESSTTLAEYLDVVEASSAVYSAPPTTELRAVSEEPVAGT